MEEDVFRRGGGERGQSDQWSFWRRRIRSLFIQVLRSTCICRPDSPDHEPTYLWEGAVEKYYTFLSFHYSIVHSIVSFASQIFILKKNEIWIRKHKIEHHLPLVHLVMIISFHEKFTWKIFTQNFPTVKLPKEIPKTSKTKPSSVHLILWFF